MTASEVLAAIRRRWFVAVIGVLVGALACGMLARAPGVYWSQVNVVFFAPQSVRNPNALQTTSQSLTSTAGIVANFVNEGVAGTALSSSSVSLVGEGIRRGHSVRLPNSGGQWANNFDRSVLDVQVTAPSEVAARDQIQQLITEIEVALDDLQRSGGADGYNLISVEPSPQIPVVQYFAPQVKRAMAGAVLLGALLTLAAVLAVDRVALARISDPRRALARTKSANN